MIFFRIQIPNTNIYVFTMAFNREDAKRKAYDWAGGNADNYIVTPLTHPEDRVVHLTPDHPPVML